MIKFKSSLLTLAMLLCSLAASADHHDFKVDGIYYDITSSSDLTVGVTYRGSRYDLFSNEYSGSVVIPEKVTCNGKEYSVTSIGVRAFWGCSGLTSVTIPNSVTSIGYSAFYDCSGLTAVHITDLSAWCKIKFGSSSSNPTYYAHHLYLNGEEITNLVIPDDITSIGDYAFYNCYGLASVTIPNSVTSIGSLAFYNCSGLTAVHITDLSAWCKIKFDKYSYSDEYSNPTYYAHHLYLNGEEITNLVIPDDVTSIGDAAFIGCSGLTSVTIPNSVTSIGEYTFSGCSGLTSIYIPESVTRISQEAFYGCSSITRIDCMAATPPLVYNKTFSSSIYSKAIIYVPLESIDLYKTADYWKEFTTIRHSGYVEVKSITFDKATYELEEGDTMKLAVTVSPEDATDKTISWKSSNETIATVNDGVVTAIKPGNATITATSICTPAVTATCKIVVTKKYVSVTAIALDKTTAELTEGETLTLTATVTPEDATDKTVAWTSSDEKVATVKDGVVTALKAGKVTITVTSTSNPSISATCEITVNAKVIPATGITLDKITAEMTEGETLSLTAIVSPENATDKTITWTSSDESIAKVSETGVVTALKAGKVTITASSKVCPTVTATCEITVNTKISAITLNKTAAEIVEGESLVLTATVSPEDATDKTVIWTSSDESIAKISENGVVTALKAGIAIITASSKVCPTVTATCEVVVKAKTVTVTGITLDKTTAEITEGETLTLTATVSPENATDKTVTWISSDESIAKVINGIVIGVKAGKATIIASCGDKVATCEITVNAKVIPATGITLDKTTAEMTEGETLTLTATVTPEDATDKTVTWTSSDETVATVKDGVVTALKAGKATITAKAGEVSATCEITVNAKVIPATGITLDKTTAELTEGETLTLTATVTPENATDKTVAWTSSDETVATVVDGVVTALKAGKATITAKSGEVSATCEITVNAKVIPATGITLDKTAAELTEGETLTLTATVSPEDATDKTVVWTSSDETVATVANGVVTALKAGKVTITAKAGEVSATCELTVNAKVIPATGIALDKTTAELTEGETLTLTATVSPEDATDKTVVWTSSDETVATVANGVVTAFKAGKATITAKAGEVSATCEITVNAKVIPATGITLDKTTAELTEGETLTLTATVTPENATDKTVVWTSSDETVATVANGVVTALKAGKVTITAKSGEVSATCEITVNAKVIPATAITLDKTTAEMTEGETLTLTATVTPEDATDKTVVWTSSDETVATVANGVVTALKAGKATITATSGDVSATCEITVIPVTGINGVICSDGYAAGNVYTVAGNLVCRKGEKLSNLPKGLYIVDGKKIVVK